MKGKRLVLPEIRGLVLAVRLPNTILYKITEAFFAFPFISEGNFLASYLEQIFRAYLIQACNTWAQCTISSGEKKQAVKIYYCYACITARTLHVPPPLKDALNSG